MQLGQLGSNWPDFCYMWAQVAQCYFRTVKPVMTLDELKRLVRKMFEVNDRPGEHDGTWRHVEEFREINAKLRSEVGAPPIVYVD